MTDLQAQERIELLSVRATKADQELAKALNSYRLLTEECRRLREERDQWEEAAEESERIAGATDDEWVTAESYDDWLSESHEKFVAMGKELHEDWAFQAKAALGLGEERIAELEREAESAESTIAALTKRAEDAEDECNAVRSERDDLRAKLADMTDRYHEASGEADRLRDRINHAGAYARKSVDGERKYFGDTLAKIIADCETNRIHGWGSQNMLAVATHLRDALAELRNLRSELDITKEYRQRYFSVAIERRDEIKRLRDGVEALAKEYDREPMSSDLEYDRGYDAGGRAVSREIRSLLTPPAQPVSAGEGEVRHDSL
ncbi:MAG TPA: hypothetical protein VGK73_31610 [Polyangiaceae bacterium]